MAEPGHTLKHASATPATPNAGYSFLYADGDGLWALTPNGVFVHMGPFGVVDATTDYTAQEGDGLILLDANTGSVDLTLPPGRDGVPFKVKVIDASNAVTVTADGSETIDGSNSVTLAQDDRVEFWWDGSQWRQY